ncbi:MAG: TRAP transporter small permease subunit [Alphaproteobacteria bacterium]|nr:MAG: TRAP transporter small permease subunit [Alphaproteobacteria bacterium]
MNALTVLARIIDAINDRIGRAVAWATVLLVLVQFVVVLLRYVFGLSFIFVQESLIYIYASLFMLGAGYTLLHNGHVRVDLFYRTASTRTKAWVNLLGVILLLLPTCVAAWVTGWPYVLASWAVREGSRETAGIQAIYILKTEILVFAVLVGLQGVAMAIHAARVLLGEEELSQEEAPRF